MGVDDPVPKPLTDTLPADSDEEPETPPAWMTTSPPSLDVAPSPVRS